MNREQITKKTESAIIKQLKERGYATCIDCLISIGWLKHEDVLKWRRGQLDCIERSCCTSTAHLNTFLKSYHQFARRYEYPLSWTAYIRKKTRQSLRFTRNNDKFAEKKYAMHIVQKQANKVPVKKSYIEK